MKRKRKPDKYILLVYLEQYYKGDSVKKEIYSKLSNDLWSINFEGSIIRSTNSERCKDEFNDIIETKRYSYFIVDKKNERETKEIVKFITGNDIEVIDLNVQNKVYDIDRLIIFKINNEIKESSNNYLSYTILCMLLDAGINHCIYSDRDGEINKKLDIRMKNKEDNRNSALGFRRDLGHVLRSSWESDFARILNYLNIEWDYEKEGFELDSKYIQGYYIPDFFLDNNIIIEIKGFWDDESRKKVRCFKEQYNNYKLLLIDSDMMITLWKLYSNKIEGWESKGISNKNEKLPVVGITIANRKKYVDNIEIGEEVYLKRELDNKYDVNAIQVLDLNGNLLGYISAEWAVIYSYKLELGMKYTAVVTKKEQKVMIIDIKRINIEEDIIYKFLKEKDK
ncbi:MAG: hypothetical protein GX347_07050 [Epulopiscium sp.]|nr:hypothetical protein [Candidatus Epulonipiscium sp.]